jgi:hypothetical protein
MHDIKETGIYVDVMYAAEHSSLKVVFVVEYLRIYDNISSLY